MYTPIIRNRQSELKAIDTLTPKVKACCTPLLDLAAPTKTADQTSIHTYLERNIQRIVTAARGFQRVLVDSSELEPSLRMRSGSHPLIEASRAIIEAGCRPIPVSGLHRDAAHMKAALKIADDVVCCRLDATDMQTGALTYNQMLKWLSANSLKPNDVILLVDLQSVYGERVEALAVQLSRFMAQIVKSTWAAIIVAGYGVPDQLSAAIAVREQGYISRLERKLYLRIAASHPIESLWFGDYTTVSPTHVELDWKKISKTISPRAIYALEDSWFVVRGGPFSTHASGYAQYHDLAKEIVALEEFCGPRYSSGDKYISERVSKLAKSGSPGTWITACVNHHITLTAELHR